MRHRTKKMDKLIIQYDFNTVELKFIYMEMKGTFDLIKYPYLIKLNCSSNKITQLANIPNTLVEINCERNQITQLDNLYQVNCSKNYVCVMCGILSNKNKKCKNPKPSNLKILNCRYNKLTGLSYLPDSIIELDCSHNKITYLDNLPSKLVKLNCSNNELIQLDNLPIQLEELFCQYNQIISLDCLPNSLIKLDCKGNQMNQLDNLPNFLLELNCGNVKITELNNLPYLLNKLEFYYCPNLVHIKNIPLGLIKSRNL